MRGGPLRLGATSSGGGCRFIPGRLFGSGNRAHHHSRTSGRRSLASHVEDLCPDPRPSGCAAEESAARCEMLGVRGDHRQSSARSRSRLPLPDGAVPVRRHPIHTLNLGLIITPLGRNAVTFTGTLVPAGDIRLTALETPFKTPTPYCLRHSESSDSGPTPRAVCAQPDEPAG